MSRARPRRLLILVLFALAGCSPFISQEQPVSTGEGTVLLDGQSIGQTFVARDAGLEGIEVFLTPDAPGIGGIQLHLLASPQSSTNLATATLLLERVTAPGFYRFSFSPQDNSSRQAYYLRLDLQGDGKVRVGRASGDQYLEGALYQNDNSVDAQMSFRLLYEPSRMLSSRLAEAAQGFGVLGIAFYLFMLPGLALLTLWSGSSTLSWAEKVGLAIGLSLALYPLLMLWTSLAQLHLGALYAWLPGLIALGVLIWRNRTWRPSVIASTWREWQRTAFWPDFALVVLFGLVFLVRFWVIRSLDVPLWGDSYQHTVIAQLITDNGGLFSSWEPYADIQTFTYHFGFHSIAAVFHWISGLSMPQAVLWSGQILNGLAVLALYPLAMRISGNPWAGVVALLLGGLLSTMPMGYINWGRYTQLAGQAILPAAIWLGWEVLQAKQRDWGSTALAWIALGGLAVTHYRILIFAALFFVAFFLLNITKLRVVLARTVALGIGAGLLFLPWFVHLFAGKIMLILGTQLSTPAAAASGWTQEYNAVGDIFSYLPTYLWLLLPFSVAWRLWLRDKGVAIFTLWWFLVLLAANPQWLRLPGEGALTNFAVFIAAYIPAGVLIGAAAGWLVGKWQQTRALVLLFVAVCALGLWGARQRLSDINLAQSALVTEPDERAAAWIQENTKPDAVFLVNAFFAYGGSSVVGSDAGWWLPLLARRRTTLPPLNYASEEGPRPDYREWINALPLEIQTKGISSPQVVALLHQRGITHVYIGQRQGQVNAPGPALLPVEQLLASPNFRSVYHQDRVWVFEVAP
jgi:hypothetical protein